MVDYVYLSGTNKLACLSCSVGGCVILMTDNAVLRMNGPNFFHISRQISGGPWYSIYCNFQKQSCLHNQIDWIKRRSSFCMCFASLQLDFFVWNNPMLWLAHTSWPIGMNSCFVTSHGVEHDIWKAVINFFSILLFRSTWVKFWGEQFPDNQVVLQDLFHNIYTLCLMVSKYRRKWFVLFKYAVRSNDVFGSDYFDRTTFAELIVRSVASTLKLPTPFFDNANFWCLISFSDNNSK